MNIFVQIKQNDGNCRKISHLTHFRYLGLFVVVHLYPRSCSEPLNAALRFFRSSNCFCGFSPVCLISWVTFTLYCKYGVMRERRTGIRLQHCMNNLQNIWITVTLTPRQRLHPSHTSTNTHTIITKFLRVPVRWRILRVQILYFRLIFQPQKFFSFCCSCTFTFLIKSNQCINVLQPYSWAFLITTPDLTADCKIFLPEIH